LAVFFSILRKEGAKIKRIGGEKKSMRRYLLEDRRGEGEGKRNQRDGKEREGGSDPPAKEKGKKDRAGTEGRKRQVLSTQLLARKGAWVDGKGEGERKSNLIKKGGDCRIKHLWESLKKGREEKKGADSSEKFGSSRGERDWSYLPLSRKGEC